MDILCKYTFPIWAKGSVRNNLPFQFPMSSSLRFNIFSDLESFCTQSHSAALGMPGRYRVWCFLRQGNYSCDARICSCCFCWILCSASVQLRKVSHVSGVSKEVLVRLFTSKRYWWLHAYVALSHG